MAFFGRDIGIDSRLKCPAMTGFFEPNVEMHRLKPEFVGLSPFPNANGTSISLRYITTIPPA